MGCVLSHSVVSRLLRPWGSPGKNTGVGSLLHRIFPAQMDLLHWQVGSLQLGPPGKRRKLELKHVHVAPVHSSTAQRVKRQEQPECPSVDEWLDTWSVYAMDYYTDTKGTEILIHATVWVNRKRITLSQSSQIRKITFYDSVSMTCPK